jgi:hypothetical protein
MNFQGIIILSLSVTDIVLSDQNKSFLSFWEKGYVVHVQRVNDMTPFADINLKLIQVSS